MSPPFDPYREWLQIPPERQPATWYDLLGLPEFDADSDRLEEAYFARYTLIRKYESGPYGTQALKLLEEVGSAYRGLANSTEKLRYDESLRGHPTEPPVVGESIDDPWRFVELLVANYEETRDVQRLEEAERRAAKADDRHGRERFARLVLQKGIEPRRFEPELLRTADKNNLAVCGECYAFVAPPIRDPCLFFQVGKTGDLASEAFSITCVSTPFQNVARIHSHDMSLIANEEVTSFRLQGLLLVATFAATLPSLFGWAIATYQGVPFTGMAKTLVAAYVLTIAAICLLYRPRFASALDAAWVVVVPAILKRHASIRESALLGGLARASRLGGRRRQRRGLIEAVLDRLLPETGGEIVSEDHVAEVFRLAFLDVVGSEANFRRFERLFQRLLAACMRHTLSLDVVDYALRSGEILRTLSPIEISTLRVRLMEACADALLGPADVAEMWDHSPTIRRLLFESRKVTDRYIAAVLKTRKLPIRFVPGQGIRSVFELLNARDHRQLERWPNLLFGSANIEIGISSEGFCYREWVFATPPKMHVRFIRCADKLGPPEFGNVESYYQLQIGPYTANFREDPFETFAHLTHVSNWYFERFLPALDQSVAMPPAPQIMQWLARRAVTCPHCGLQARFARGEILHRSGS